MENNISALIILPRLKLKIITWIGFYGFVALALTLILIVPRACLITLHSNFEIFQKGHPAVEFMLDRRIFERWFRITPHDVGLKCFPDKL